MVMTKNKRFDIRVDENLHDTVLKMAEAEERTPSSMCCVLLKEAIKARRQDKDNDK